jgi:hypothetical protein
VIENVATVPVFVAKPRAKFLNVQKLDKQLLFKLVRAIYGDDFGCCINDRRVQEIDNDETLRLYSFFVL